MPKLQRAYTVTKRSKLNTGAGLTEQSHKDQTDMNHILRDYQRTGFIKHAKQNAGRYDDVTSQDFQTAMLKVTNAQNMFNNLPSNIRKRFENNPGKFLDFVQNKNNVTEMASLGILKGNDGIDITGASIDSPVTPPQIAPEKGKENTGV